MIVLKLLFYLSSPINLPGNSLFLELGINSTRYQFSELSSFVPVLLCNSTGLVSRRVSAPTGDLLCAYVAP